MNKWIKQEKGFCGIGFSLYGLDDFGILTRISHFIRGKDELSQFRVDSDKSYIFAEKDAGETMWRLLSRIPEEVICQIDYLEEEGIENL